MGHRMVPRTIMQPTAAVCASCSRESLWAVAASSKYHVKELSPKYSFIVCVIEEASSNYYRLKKIRSEAATHIFILYHISQILYVAL